MSKRKIEIFSAGCPACEEVIKTVKEIACPSCDGQVLNMRQPDAAARAEVYGVRALPAIVINGKLAGCCSTHSVEAETLMREGVGVPLS